MTSRIAAFELAVHDAQQFSRRQGALQALRMRRSTRSPPTMRPGSGEPARARLMMRDVERGDCRPTSGPRSASSASTGAPTTRRRG